MTQSSLYHDPFAAVPPDVVAAIEEQCGMPIEEAVEKYGGQPVLCPDGTYVAFAHPPGCGREHFAAVAEVYRELLERWGQQERARRIAEVKAVPRLDATPAKPRRQRTPRVRPSDGLMIEAEAAAKLGISVKLLREHVADGSLRYVSRGRGRKRIWRGFTHSDLDEFIANMTRKDSPCPSAATRARRSGSTDSKSEIVSFSEAQRRRRSAKPKR